MLCNLGIFPKECYYLCRIDRSILIVIMKSMYRFIILYNTLCKEDVLLLISLSNLLFILCVVCKAFFNYMNYNWSLLNNGVGLHHVPNKIAERCLSQKLWVSSLFYNSTIPQTTWFFVSSITNLLILKVLANYNITNTVVILCSQTLTFSSIFSNIYPYLALCINWYVVIKWVYISDYIEYIL